MAEDTATVSPSVFAEGEGDTPPAHKESPSARLKRWWATPEGQRKRKEMGEATARRNRERAAAKRGETVESKDKAPKTAREAPVPKGSIAKGAAAVWKGVGWIVENFLGDRPVGQAMKLQSGVAGRSLDTFLKSKFPAAHVALYPILGEVAEWSDAANVVMLPLLVGAAERMPMVPPPMQQAIRGACVPILKSYIEDQRNATATEAEIRQLEAEAGVTINELLDVIFPRQQEPPPSGEPDNGQVEQQEARSWLQPES